MGLRIDLSMNNDLLHFFVFLLVDMDCLAVLDIDKSLTCVLEDVEPLSIGAPDLHHIAITIVFDVP